MKKIYLKENSIQSVLTKRLLPQFLFKMVKTHTTSLGDSEIFPNGDEYPFDYIILKERYNEVCDAIEDLGITELDEDNLISEMSILLKECKELEEPVRDALEKLCENAVNRLFAIPSEILNIKCKLVDGIKFKNAIRLRPESDEDIKYTFADVDDIEFSKKAIAKRRVIDSLIQGGSYLYANIIGLYIDEINKINPKLLKLYRAITVINDYLLFTKEEEMTDDKPMQGSYVETHLGMDGEKTTISVQGIIFPLLLQETIKGLFELFSSHGLPSDKEKAKYIVRKADFVLAEPWDLRLGVGLWKRVFGKVQDTNMIPYMFANLVSLSEDEFTLSMKEILSNTQKGNEIVNDLMQSAEYDSGYQQFQNRINAKNLDRSLIKDSYFTGAETNGYEIDDTLEDGDVIEEDGETDGNIETFYRGIHGNFDICDFGVNREYICAWLAETPEYAAEYASNHEDGHLYAVKVDMSKFKRYNWYADADSWFDPYDGFSNEEEQELLEMGYNGYTFPLDECEVLVLFDPSLIVGVEEIPIAEYLEESVNVTPNNDNDVLSTATVENIDFVEGHESEYEEEVFLSINGVQVPREIVNLTFRPIYKRFPKGKKQLLNIDIILDQSARGQGLGTKIYAKAVKEFGAICSRFSTRHNDNGIRGIFAKLAEFEDICTFEDTYQNPEGETISDYYAILKSQLNNYF